MASTHGITYTPENITSSTTARPTLQNVVDTSKSAGVTAEEAIPYFSYVHLYWVDLANIRRCRIMPAEYFRELMRSRRPGVQIAKASLGLVYLMLAEGFSGRGEYLYTPDPRTMRVLRGVSAGDVLGVFGRFEEKDTRGRNGVEVALCPRTLLGRIIDEAKNAHATEFLVGFETEFIMLKSTNPVVPSNIHQWSSTSALLLGSPEANILTEIGDSLRASGIPLQLLHAEAAPGQYEVVTGPLSPLDAADTLIFTREIITHVAAKHGLHVTFAPRPFMNSTGSSTHAHVSVHSPKSTKIADGLSTHERAFLAGVLEHLPAVAAFTLPTYASYKRVADGSWSGGTYVSYGTENREAPVRLTNSASPSSRRFELRFIDGTANPHLALAAVLGSALVGIRDNLVLESQDCKEKSAAEMTGEERLAMGITKRLPLGVEEAAKNLRDDKVLTEVMGEDMVRAFLSVSKTLGEALRQETDEGAQLTRLVEFY
ncbi:glutamine synthetase guanido kinase [Collybia nuda]|uniref:Glutamine synthetase n=1 Tax=Collybia nuda TaxID=64659 RepID=A0A9P5XYF1_9AGAR|nr:glutamine synthetase guanido kinase [Collybia nuda]